MYASIGRCTAPCEDEEAAREYAREVQRVRDFLMGQDPSVLNTLEAQMHRAAAEMRYEEAASFRDWHQKLERMLRKQQQVAAPVLEHNAVLVQPGEQDGTVQVFLVRFGRHAETVMLSLPPEVEEVACLREALALHFDPARGRPTRYYKQEVDEVRLLAHWLYLHRDSTAPIQWTPDRTPDDLLRAVLRHIEQPLLQ